MLGGSSSQSYYIDPDAISKITVYDVNVPAEYGGFTGGVVDAELLRYQGEDYTAIKYAISGSDLLTQRQFISTMRHRRYAQHQSIF